MHLPRSFLSGDPVIAFHGQWMELPPYLLEPGDAALDQGCFGPCYTTELIASPWGPFYAERLRTHALSRGLEPLGHRGSWAVFHSPNTGQIEAIGDDGFELALPRRPAKEVAGVTRIAIEEEFNLVLDDHPLGAEIMGPVQQALRDQGSYPVWPLLVQLGISHHLREPALGNASLLRDDESVMYWTPKAISAVAAYDVVVPDELVSLLS